MRDVYANTDDPRGSPRALDAASPPRRSLSRSSARTGRRTSPITPAARRRPRSTSWPARSRSSPAQARVRLGLRGGRLAGRALRPRAGRRLRLVLRPQRARHRRQVGADRPRPRRGDPGVERAPISASGRPKLIVRSAPAIAFAGTPLFNVYLRCWARRSARNAVIATRDVSRSRRTCSRSARTRSSWRRALMPGYARVRQPHASRADPARPQRLCRRAERARHRHRRSAISASSATPRRCSAASACPTASAMHGSPAEETTTSFRLADECPGAAGAARAVHRAAGSPSSSPSPARWPRPS